MPANPIPDSVKQQAAAAAQPMADRGVTTSEQQPIATTDVDRPPQEWEIKSRTMEAEPPKDPAADRATQQDRTTEVASKYSPNYEPEAEQQPQPEPEHEPEME